MSKIVIIGNCAAGLSALENFRLHDMESDVTIISKEGNDPYSRVLLPYILRGKLPYTSLKIRDDQYFENLKANRVTDEIVRLDTENKLAIGSSGTSYPYDKLLIATGSYAVTLPIEGIRAEGIYNMWTRSDLDHLIPLFDKSKRVCVIGSGFVALQAAWAARSRGMEVTIVELMTRIMPTVLDEQAAEVLKEKIAECGCTLLTGAATQSFEKLEDGSFKVHIKDHEDVLCDFVILGTGVRSNVQFLEGSGVEVNRGIPVDNHMRTNVEDVYAAGDVASGPTVFGDEHLVHALWPTACEMGKVAAENMAGIPTVYEGSLNMNVTQMYNVTVASIGKFNDADIDSSYIYPESAGLGYLKICFKDGLLIGACLVGSSDAVHILGKMRPYIRRKQPLNCAPQDIEFEMNREIYESCKVGERL